MDDDVEELNQQYPMHQEDITQILAYLSLPPASSLPQTPLAFLSAHINALPPPLLRPFSSVTTPRQRSSIRQIKARRLVYASSIPPPPELQASAGRLRWPLLWERMGGAHTLPLPSSNIKGEEAWVKDHFLPGAEGRQHVKKLGGFLRGLEEEREMEEMRAAKRAERRLDDVGEEFDEESDEEEDGGEGRQEKERAAAAKPIQGEVGENQNEVVQAFERKLLEMFVDGIDTVSYDDVDFTEPDTVDPIAVRDAEDHYFDEEEPSEDGALGATRTDEQRRRGILAADGDETPPQNGTGEYDY